MSRLAKSAWGSAAAAVLAVCAAASPVRAEGLSVGDPAPELEVTAWVQGDELKMGENPDKRVRIVEFFNAYDQGCAAVAPDLEKLHKELGPKGVDLIAITTQGKTAAEDFVKNREVTFRVAIDTYENTNAAYMKGVNRLPYCFVADREGRVAWTGAPDEGLRKVVDEILAGTFDIKRATRIAELTRDLFASLDPPDTDAMAKAADALLEAEPSNGFAMQIRLNVFERKDDAAGFHEWVRAYVERAKDDADAQSSMAWRLVTHGEFAWRDPELAHTAAKRGVELTQSKDADKLDTYARVLFELGLLEDAIREAKKSVAIEDSAAVKERLQHYEACLAARKKIQKKK